jgi:hypothetical protein
MTKFVPALFVLIFATVCHAQSLDTPPANFTITLEQQRELLTRCSEAVEKLVGSEDKDEAKVATGRKKVLEALAVQLLRQPGGQVNYAQTMVLVECHGWTRLKKNDAKNYFSAAQHEAMLKGGLWLSAYYGQPRFKKLDPTGKYSKEIDDALSPIALKVAAGKALTVDEELTLIKAFVTVHVASNLASPADIAQLEKKARGK